MVTSAILAFLHHLAALLVVVALSVEFALFERNLDVVRARRIQRIDLMYGISAGLLLVIGLLRVAYFEKGASYYFSNPFFIAKLVVFLGVALLSAYPTLRFLAWNKDTKQQRAPAIGESEYRLIRRILHWQLLGIVVILFCAAFMAHGIG